jgi:predicted TPR repeat methyltransferase
MRINRKGPKNLISVTAAENSRRFGKHPHLRSAVVISDQPLTDKRLRMPLARQLLADAWLGRARQLRRNGNVRQAEIACRRAVALNPQHPESHHQLVMNLHALERYDEAIPFLKKVLALKPHDPTAGHLLNALEKRPIQRAPSGYAERLFNRFAATFDDRMRVDLNYRVPVMLANRIRPIARRRGQFDSALDLGCGTGLSGSAITSHARHLTGVDLSREMLRKASEKAIYDVLVCDDILNFLNRCKTTFDLIMAADVFIYIGDVTSVFRLVRQRLDSTGIFAFSTERTRFAPFRLKKNGRLAHSPNYIYRLAKENGLIVLSRDRIGLRLEHHQWVNGDLFLIGGSSHGEKQSRHRPHLKERIRHFLKTTGWVCC